MNCLILIVHIPKLDSDDIETLGSNVTTSRIAKK